MSETTWLETLKAGDEVVIVGGYHHAGRLAKVDKITATQLIVGGDRFRKDTGWERGGSVWGRTSIKEATPERRKAIAVQAARSFLSGADWKKLPDDDVLAIAELARKAVPR